MIYLIVGSCLALTSEKKREDFFLFLGLRCLVDKKRNVFYKCMKLRFFPTNRKTRNVDSQNFDCHDISKTMEKEIRVYVAARLLLYTFYGYHRCSPK
jgi:hypothetical protein